MGPFVALILTIQAHAAVLKLAGPFDTLEQCRSEIAHMKADGLGCAPASDINAATMRLFNKPASEIWR
jgi:hypothetical protein